MLSIKRIILLLYTAYLMFALALNAFMLPIWAAPTLPSERGWMIIGVLMIATGVAIIAMVYVAALYLKGQQSQRSETSEVLSQRADIQPPQAEGVCQHNHRSTEGD